MKIKVLNKIALCMCFVTIAAFVTGAQEVHKTLYVWNFSTRDREITPLTRSITDEFEVALKESGAYNILERRSKDRLEHQTIVERVVSGAKDITGKEKSDLNLDSADMVVFGEIYDDVASGQVSITVHFEDWKGVEHLIKEIDIPRGKINDKPTRQAAMAELAGKIVAGNRPVLKSDSHSFIVEIKKCHAQGEDVSIDLILVNNSDLDHELTLKIEGSDEASNLFDNNGNQVVCKFARIANQEGRGYLRSLLISGIPVKCSLDFSGVPTRATTITRLFINMSEGGQNFQVAFKGIPIER